ncbi:MAG: ATP-dependent Clp protease ATP-binding subunit, partial [Vallitaleaceae bacterium]|nr:ATP-dependent Clp protease ATP-binding subunit [Vallitaleaceae bacterium]
MKCAICKMNTAVVFITKIHEGKPERLGICLTCASKQGLNPLDQMLKQSGMSSSDLDNLNEQMMEMFENPELSESLNDIMTQMTENGEFPMDFLGSLAGATTEKDDVEEEEIEDEPLVGESFQNTKASSDATKSSPSSDDSESDETSSQGNDLFSTLFGRRPTKVKEKTNRNKRKNLDAFGINLTEKAKLGQVDRIIGRHREIDRVIQILNRRQKNNPVLIGEPGVGKTAIAEGLAVRIVEGQVPQKLLNSEIYLLDLTALVAGTQFRGQFEGRMKAVINEARSSGNVILVIDEVHNIVGAGEAENGAMNAANILKPALARGEVQIIGATTIEEYRKHIEKDSALERRFQPVMVEEPSIEESIEIIKGIKDYYQSFHKVQISDEIIELAVRMSERYIHERFLPDKAIDVIDEAGSRANLKNQGLVELEALKVQLEKVVRDKEEAASVDDFEKAADCRVEELRISNKIQKLSEECDNVTIQEEDIAYVIEAWTRIPVQSIKEDEKNKLLNLEERLKRRVKGQDHAIVSLAKAIRRNRSGFKKRFKPSSFIFVGPTGVGKTELSKALAEELFGNEEAMIRFDMSEYMEKHT